MLQASAGALELVVAGGGSEGAGSHNGGRHGGAGVSMRLSWPTKRNESCDGCWARDLDLPRKE